MCQTPRERFSSARGDIKRGVDVWTPMTWKLVAAGVCARPRHAAKLIIARGPWYVCVLFLFRYMYIEYICNVCRISRINMCTYAYKYMHKHIFIIMHPPPLSLSLSLSLSRSLARSHSPSHLLTLSPTQYTYRSVH